MHEKRRFTRIDSSLGVDIVLEDGTEVTGCLRDLSMRGVYVETDVEPAPGVQCYLTVYLAGREREIVLEIEGTVVHCEPHGQIGVRFDELSFEDFDRLRDVVMSGSNDPERIEAEIDQELGVECDDA